MSSITLHRYIANRRNLDEPDSHGNVLTKNTIIQNVVGIGFLPGSHNFHVVKNHIYIDKEQNTLVTKSLSVALSIDSENPIIPDFVNGFIAYSKNLQIWKDFPNG